MKLSAREKMLLIILGVLLIVYAGFQFVLTPGIIRLQTARSEVNALTAQKQQMDLMLTQMADAEALLTQEQQRSDAQTYFYASLNGVAMDRLLQTLAAQSNVTIASIYLPFAAQPQAVVPFGQAPITVAAENGTAEENPAAGPIVPMYQCTATVTGTPNDVMALITAINGLGKSVQVSSMGTPGQENIKEGVLTEVISVDFYEMSA